MAELEPFRSTPRRASVSTDTVSAACLLVAVWAVASAPVAQSPQTAITEPPGRELLNSERIERAFGSYGIDVLASDNEIRISNLYSFSDGQKICRTFAVVRYPTVVDPLFADEHALILAGESIGSTFASRGWQVNKTHRYFGELGVGEKLAELMGGVGDTDLAVHVYVLEVVKGDAAFEYAAIAEMHHPDYLSLSDLHRIYGAGIDIPTPLDDLARGMLAVAAERLASGD